MVTWEILSDTDDDGQFDDTDILSVRVMSVRIMRGFTDAFNRVAPVATCRMVVRNVDHKLNLERIDALDLQVGRYIRVRANTGSAYTVFTGVILQVNRINRGQSEIIALSRLYLDNQPVALPLLQGYRVDQILSEVFKNTRSNFFHPLKTTGGVEYCVIGSSTIGSCQILSDDAPNQSLARAQSTLAQYGGVRSGRQTARQILEDVVRAEWGYFFEDADGNFVFKDRYHLINNRSVSLTATDLDNVEYEYGGNMINEVRASVIPRAEETVVLWATDDDVTVSDGHLSLQAEASDGRVLGVLTVDPIDISGCEIHSVRADADAINLFIEGDTIPAGTSISGTAVVQQNPIEIIERRYSLQHGARSITLQGVELSDVERTREFCKWLLGLYGDERGIVKRISTARANLANWLQREILDIVNVDVDELNHDADYYIRAIEYKGAAGTIEIFFHLEPVAEDKYLVIGETGRNLIGTNWVIGY